MVTSVQSVTRIGRLKLLRLFEANLISGFWDNA
jgi:hypothetical protein